MRNHQLGMIQNVLDSIIIVGLLVLINLLYPKSLAWNDKYTIVAISAVALFYIAAKVNKLYQSYRIGGFGHYQNT